MSDILPYAELKVEVLNDHCWQNCEDFEPYLAEIFYTENYYYEREISVRKYKCKNLNRCKRLSLYLERSEEK